MKSQHFFSFIIFTLIAFVASSTPVASFAQGVRTVVIDPGHGGVFPGATYNGVKEKDLTLAVALKLGAIMKRELPTVKLVYTRTTDIELSKSLAQDLHARTMIANNASGDLFISIHANAASNPAAYGAESILMGESSVEQQRNEAALYTANRDQLLDMSDQKTAAIVRAYIQNLQYTYGQYSEAFARLIQKSYASKGRKVRDLRYQLIKVLYGTDMPCVLTEIGFMTNPKEFAYMTSQRGQEEIARCIFDGIKSYIDMVNKTISSSPAPKAEPKPAPKAEPKPAPKAEPKRESRNTPTPSELKEAKRGEKVYTIQIMSSGTAISPTSSSFKNYKGKTWCRVVEGAYKYKYCVGKFSSSAEAQGELKRVRETFKDAFISSYIVE